MNLFAENIIVCQRSVCQLNSNIHYAHRSIDVRENIVLLEHRIGKTKCDHESPDGARVEASQTARLRQIVDHIVVGERTRLQIGRVKHLVNNHRTLTLRLPQHDHHSFVDSQIGWRERIVANGDSETDRSNDSKVGVKERPLQKVLLTAHQLSRRRRLIATACATATTFVEANNL